jgi:hypothetical protein
MCLVPVSLGFTSNKQHAAHTTHHHPFYCLATTAAEVRWVGGSWAITESNNNNSAAAVVTRAVKCKV